MEMNFDRLHANLASKHRTWKIKMSLNATLFRAFRRFAIFRGHEIRSRAIHRQSVFVSRGVMQDGWIELKVSGEHMGYALMSSVLPGHLVGHQQSVTRIRGTTQVFHACAS